MAGPYSDHINLHGVRRRGFLLFLSGLAHGYHDGLGDPVVHGATIRMNKILKEAEATFERADAAGLVGSKCAGRLSHVVLPL